MIPWAYEARFALGYSLTARCATYRQRKKDWRMITLLDVSVSVAVA